MMSKERFLSTSIVKWYIKHGRHDLPWRKQISPYRVWISEIMLQQTQVKTAVPYFKKFISRLPSLKQLINASEDEIMALWSGLGFYKRARNIIFAKDIIKTKHRGRFPPSYGDMLALPGIGKSTAGAISSIAFNQPQPILDGNVKRVLARFYADARNQNFSDKLLWQLSEQSCSTNNAFAYTQGIMDIGATICTPFKPNCYTCPLNKKCGSAFIKVIKPKPIKLKKLPVIGLDLELVKYKDSLLLRKIEDQDIWKGLWAPFEKQKIPYKLKTLKQKEVSHKLSHRVIDLSLTLSKSNKRFNLDTNLNYDWINIKDIEKFGMPKPIKQFVSSI